MEITFDPAKRSATLEARGLDFVEAAIVFDGRTYDIEDTHKDYGEQRWVTIGFLDDRMVVVGWTPRGSARHVFTMRKCNDREQKKYAPFLV